MSVCRQHRQLLVVDCRGLHRWRHSNLWGVGSLVLAAQGTDPGLSIRPLSSRGGLRPSADIGQPADRHLEGTNTLSQIYLGQLGRPAYKLLSGLSWRKTEGSQLPMEATAGVRQFAAAEKSRQVLHAQPFRVVAALAVAGLAMAQTVSGTADAGFHWTPAKVVLAIFLFLAAGLCEIGGGWLVWQVQHPAHILGDVRVHATISGVQRCLCQNAPSQFHSILKSW